MCTGYKNFKKDFQSYRKILSSHITIDEYEMIEMLKNSALTYST